MDTKHMNICFHISIHLGNVNPHHSTFHFVYIMATIKTSDNKYRQGYRGNGASFIYEGAINDIYALGKQFFSVS